MDTLFISDLHLHSDRPEKLELFKSLLNSAANKNQKLYILGDLFEAWVGDDDITPPHSEIVEAMANFTTSGHQLFIMRGNRDYLIGEQFKKSTGAEIIPDQTIIEINNRKILLMHGDTLCTLDIQYQLFRKFVNNPVSIKLFLNLPLKLRQKIWHGMRTVTVKSTSYKETEITDVFQPTVEEVMQDYNVDILIHGHTHKTNIHGFSIQNKPAYRYVLGDWYENENILIAGESGIKFLRIKHYLRIH